MIGLILMLITNFSIQSSSLKTIDQSSMTMCNGNNFYVGGNGPGNYTKIQDALDDTNDGDTVFVYNGIYNEKLWIYNKINLIGEDSNTTIIDGKNFSNYKGQVNILSDWVNFSGFTIQRVQDTGIALDLVNVSNVNVSHNILKGAWWCWVVTITISSDITLYKNIICNSKSNYGLKLDLSDRIHIFKNKFTRNLRAIKSYRVNQSDIRNNYFINNTEGLSLSRFHNGTIFGNIIENNRGRGISLEKSNNNIISGNIIRENDGTGIAIKYNSRDNIVTKNIVENNINGIVITNTFNSEVTLNNIMGNNEAGISIRSPNSIITNNNLMNNHPNANFRFFGEYTIGRLPIRGFFQGLKDSFSITISNNFWNHSRTNPVLIKGKIISEGYPSWVEDVEYKWWKFDWNPASNPHIIII